MLTYILFGKHIFWGVFIWFPQNEIWARPGVGLICIICGSDTIKHDVSSNVLLTNSADVSYQLNCWFQTEIAKAYIRNTDTVWVVLEFKFVHLFVFAGRDWNPEAAAWGQSDVHQNRGEAEDGQDGRWLGSEMERCTAVKEKKQKAHLPWCLALCQPVSLTFPVLLFLCFLIRLCHLTALFTITLIIPTSRRLPQNTHVYWWERIGNEHSRKQVYKRMQYLQMSFSRTKSSSVNTRTLKVQCN